MAQIVRHLLASKLAWLLILILLAVTLRWTAIELTIVERPLRADATEYYATAYNLRFNGTYSRSLQPLINPTAKVEPDAYRPPGLPLLIAAIITPQSGTAIIGHMQAINLLFGIITVAVVFVAAAAVLPLPAAIVVGLLVACSPHLVSFTVYVLSETPSAFLVAILLGCAAIKAPSSRRMRAAFFVAFGAVVGVLSLFRPVFLAFTPLLALAYPKRDDKWRCLLFACLGAAIVVAPWFIRNALNVPRTVAPSLLAATMLDGAYPGFVYQGNMATFPYGSRSDPIFKEAEKSVSLTLKEIARKIAENPIAMARWYLFEKPVYLFQWNNIDGTDIFIYDVRSTPFHNDKLFQTIYIVFRYTHLPVLILSVMGAMAAWLPSTAKHLSPDQLPLLRVASLMLPFVYVAHIPFFAAIRYAAPILPAIYLLAVFAVVALRFRFIESAKDTNQADGGSS